MQENNGRRNPFLHGPAFVLPLLIAFGTASFFSIGKLGKVPSLLIVAALLLITFSVSLVLALRLRGAGWIRGCFGGRKRGGFAVCLAASALMMVQSAAIRSFLFSDLYDYRMYSLYGVSLEGMADSPGLFFGAFLLLGAVPALLEAVLFRGILMHEYRFGGVGVSIAASSVLYALLGMSYADFPVYFLNGVLLSAVVFLTGNLLYSVLSHLLYLLFAMTFEKYFLFIAAEAETRVLLFLVLAALGLASLIWFCGSAEKILRQRGEDEEKAPGRLKKGRMAIVFWDMLSAPFLWADIVCFVLVCVLHIFL